MSRLFPPAFALTGLSLVIASSCAAPDPGGGTTTGSSATGDSGIDPTTTTGMTGSTTNTDTGVLDPTTGITSTSAGDTDSEDPIQEDCDATLELIVRDFNSSHPDMQANSGGWADIGCGMVMPDLFVGTDGARTPLFQAGNGTGKRVVMDNVITCTLWDPMTNPQPSFQEIAGEDSFNQWYSNVDGINMTSSHVLELAPVDPADPESNYYFDSKEIEGGRFFPADGMGFDEDTNGHNYHFTTEAHVRFTYKSGDKFTFSGDDDMWIFVNEKLALDLGGMHGPLSATIDFDAQKAELGIEAGKVYNMDIFHAERHTADSNYRIETSIGCFEKVEVPDVIIR